MEKKRYQAAARARATYEFLTCFVVGHQGIRQLHSNEDGTLLDVGVREAEYQSSKDDRGGRVLIPRTGVMLLMRRSLSYGQVGFLLRMVSTKSVQRRCHSRANIDVTK